MDSKFICVRSITRYFTVGRMYKLYKVDMGDIDILVAIANDGKERFCDRNDFLSIKDNRTRMIEDLLGI